MQPAQFFLKGKLDSPQQALGVDNLVFEFATF